MKKIVFISLLTTALAFNTACTDEVAYDQEEYASVLHMKTSGVVNLEFYNIGQDVTFETFVSRGGTDPSIAGEASLVVFTEEELATYNAGYGSDFKLLPADCYTMPTKVLFESGQGSVPVKFVLKSNIGNLDQTKSYILPVRIASENHNVYEYKNSLLLHPEVITPTVSLEHSGVQKMTMGVGDDPVKFETSLLFDYFNEWAFTVNMNTSRAELQELVDRYNSDNSATGITYQLLPEANYTMPSSVAFTADDFSKGLSVEINAENNLQEGDYLLPIVLKNITGAPLPFEVSDRICYIHLEYKDILPLLNVTTGMISVSEVSSTTNPNWMFDGVGYSLWSTPSTSVNNDATYGQYIDIKLGGTGFTKMLKFDLRTKWSDSKPHTVQLFGGTSQDDLRPIISPLDIGSQLVLPTDENYMLTDKTNDAEGAAAAGKHVIYVGERIPLDRNITYLRFSILKTFDGQGKPWSSGMATYDQTQTSTAQGHPISISELRFYGK